MRVRRRRGDSELGSHTEPEADRPAPRAEPTRGAAPVPTAGDAATAVEPPTAAEGQASVAPPVEIERHVEIERGWSPVDVVTALGGAALTIAGIVALTRTGVDGSWYQPVEQVAGFDHTALLGAIEVGIGVVLVLLGLARARALTALVCLATAVAAAVVAVEPDLVDRELAIERSWAVLLAAGATVLAILALRPWSKPAVSREVVTARRADGLPVDRSDEGEAPPPPLPGGAHGRSRMSPGT